MDKIIDNLYLGDIRAAANLFLLKSHVRFCRMAKVDPSMPQESLTGSNFVGSDTHLASLGRAEPVLPFSKSWPFPGGSKPVFNSYESLTK